MSCRGSSATWSRRVATDPVWRASRLSLEREPPPRTCRKLDTSPGGQPRSLSSGTGGAFMEEVEGKWAIVFEVPSGSFATLPCFMAAVHVDRTTLSAQVEGFTKQIAFPSWALFAGPFFPALCGSDQNHFGQPKICLSSRLARLFASRRAPGRLPRRPPARGRIKKRPAAAEQTGELCPPDFSSGGANRGVVSTSVQQRRRK